MHISKTGIVSVYFSAAFGQTVEELSDHEDESAGSHRPAVKFQAVPNITPIAVSPSAEIDLWDAAPVSRPKTTDQILSLFNAPLSKPKQEVDLLTSSFYDEAQVSPAILDGSIEISPTTMASEKNAEVPSQPIPSVFESVVHPPSVPGTLMETSDEKAPEVNEDEKESELPPPPPPPPVKVSSPSEEEALRPLQLELEAPSVTLTEPTTEQEEKPQTAAAFMEEWSPVIPHESITPPTPLSPPGPSPVPSVVTTPTLAEGPPPDQYQPPKPPVVLTPPEELPPAHPPRETKPPEPARPPRPPPPPRPAPPPMRPQPPSVDTTPAAPPVTPFNMFDQPPDADSAAALSAFPELSASPSEHKPSPLGIFDSAPAQVAPAPAALDIFSAPAPPAPAVAPAAPVTNAFDIFSAAAVPSAPDVARRVPPPAPPRHQPPPASPNPFLATAEVPAEAVAAGGADAFDAFAERFAKAADEQTADVFDPFGGVSSGPSATTASGRSFWLFLRLEIC